MSVIQLYRFCLYFTDSQNPYDLTTFTEDDGTVGSRVKVNWTAVTSPRIHNPSSRNDRNSVTPWYHTGRWNWVLGHQGPFPDRDQERWVADRCLVEWSWEKEGTEGLPLNTKGWIWWVVVPLFGKEVRIFGRYINYRGGKLA